MDPEKHPSNHVKNTCQCPACSRERSIKEEEARKRKAEAKKAEEARIQAESDRMIEALQHAFFGPAVKAVNATLSILDIDEIETQANKGRRFTVLGRIDGIKDTSYVGDVFEVVSICGTNIVAKKIVDSRGYKESNGKNMVISTKQYGTRPVLKHYVDALLQN